MAWAPAVVGSIAGLVRDVIGINPVEERNRWLMEWEQSNIRFDDWRRDDVELDLLRKIKVNQEAYKLQKMELEMSMKLRSARAAELAAMARAQMAGYSTDLGAVMNESEIARLSLSEVALPFRDEFFVPRAVEFRPYASGEYARAVVDAPLSVLATVVPEPFIPPVVVPEPFIPVYVPPVVAPVVPPYVSPVVPPYVSPVVPYVPQYVATPTIVVGAPEYYVNQPVKYW